MGMTKEDFNEFNKPLPEKMDQLIDLLRRSEQAYWCKWCKRHIPPDKIAAKNGGLLFVHDDVYHPIDCTFDSGDEHRIH
jgi:hypothetical protein